MHLLDKKTLSFHSHSLTIRVHNCLLYDIVQVPKKKRQKRKEKHQTHSHRPSCYFGFQLSATLFTNVIHPVLLSPIAFLSLYSHLVFIFHLFSYNSQNLKHSLAHFSAIPSPIRLRYCIWNPGCFQVVFFFYKLCASFFILLIILSQGEQSFTGCCCKYWIQTSKIFLPDEIELRQWNLGWNYFFGTIQT